MDESGNAVVLHLVGDGVYRAKPVVLQVEELLAARAQRHQVNLAAAAVVGEDVPAVIFLFIGGRNHHAEPAILQLAEQLGTELRGRLGEGPILHVSEVQRIERFHLAAAVDLHGFERGVPLAAAFEAHFQFGGQRVGHAIEYKAVHQQRAACGLAGDIEMAVVRDKLHRRVGGQRGAVVDRAQQVLALLVGQFRLLLVRNRSVA